MNLLLIPTNQLNCDLPGLNFIPGLGLLQLAASCEKRGIACEIIDLSEYNIFPEKDYNSIFDAIIKKILSYNPEIVGFSTIITNSIIAIELCRKLKEKKHSIFTILGGPGVSFCAGGIIREFTFIDAVIRGEADMVFPEFILQLQAKKEEIKVKGLVWKKNGIIEDNGWPAPIDDLDSLPFPSYDKYSYSDKNHLISPFFDGVRSVARIEIGRGCPYNCAFCSTSRFFNNKYRLKSVERIIKEMLYVKRKLDCTCVQFVHDLLTFDSTYVTKLCDAIKKHAPTMKWFCESRLDTINYKLLKKMADSGCSAIFFGIEAGSKRMQKILHKNLDLTKLNDILIALKRNKVNGIFSFVLGFPGEEKPDLEKLLSIAMKAKFFPPGFIEIQFHYLRLDPGSDVYLANLSNLKYNDFCAPFRNGSNIPHECHGLKEVVKRNPELFPADFYIYNPDVSNEDSLKCSYMEYFINEFLNKSLWFAYKILGDTLPAGIVRNLDKITLPLYKISTFTHISSMAASINYVVREMLKDNPSALEKYNTLSQYEIAILEIQYEKTSAKIIDVYYNPKKLISDLCKDNRDIQKKSDYKKLLHFMITRDEKNDKLQCREIPEELASFIKKP